jgi:hypothetical protein
MDFVPTYKPFSAISSALFEEKKLTFRECPIKPSLLF